MPSVEIEAAERAAWWSEASSGELRQVIVSDSDFHMSDRAFIILSICPVLTIEQLNVRGKADGIDHMGRDACLRMKRCEREPPVKKDGGKKLARTPGLAATCGEFPT